MDGFYAGYFTGTGGNGIAMFVLQNGVIVGVDAMGVKFDGNYEAVENGFRLKVKISAPAGGTLVQGMSTGSTGLTYEIDTIIPGTLDSIPYLTIPTPFGPVNSKFKKLRDA
jgi:hypothetical protein